MGKAAWQDEQARQIFEKLKATNRYRLLLIWGLQTILEKFDPGEL
jgi:hypothetical protein